MDEQHVGRQTAPQTSGGRWRFTLREALLATTAIAAVLALVSSWRSPGTTRFFEEFNAQDMLEEIGHRDGLAIDIGGSGAMSTKGSGVAVQTLGISLQSPDPSEAGRVMTELHRDIEALLSQHRCRIRGRGLSGDPAMKNVGAFSFDYKYGRTRGDI